jgi:Holliday junction DNA helicase RuvA
MSPVIDFLHGRLVEKSPAAVTVQVAGLGFRINVPFSTYEALPTEGTEVRLHTHLHVREDEMSLYGFASASERTLFRMLLGVSRIGPMVALRVLSGCRPEDFKRYVLDGDADSLQSLVKGIGAKTAKRLVVELQGPIEDLAVATDAVDAGSTVRDAVQALVALGESRASAERSVRAAVDKLGADADLQEIVEEALSG